MVRAPLVSLRRLGDWRNSQWQPSTASTTSYGEEKLRMWIIKKEDLALDSWDTYERNAFSKPRLAPSHIEKSTKFLNLRYLVFFNSQKYFWCSDYLPFIANFCIIWHLPPPLGTFPAILVNKGWHSHSICCHHWRAPRKLRMWKCRILVDVKGTIAVSPESTPLHRKVLSSSTEISGFL